MLLLKLFVLTAAVLLVLSLARARSDREDRHGFLDRVHKDADGVETKYVLFVPHGYRGDQAYPLILFLHGAGECGTDNRQQVDVGLGPVIRRQEETFPCFVLFPQMRRVFAGGWQATSRNGRRVLDIVDEIQRAYHIDASRLYLTGLSMGGNGTWSIAEKQPERWAAIVPICGWGEPNAAAKLKDLPCWCFHGEQDEAVDVQQSRDMIEALRQAGGEPRYDEYSGVGHNSWDRAYATHKLFDWLLQQRRK